MENLMCAEVDCYLILVAGASWSLALSPTWSLCQESIPRLKPFEDARSPRPPGHFYVRNVGRQEGSSGTNIS